jgi:PIN domain nuclease of toxin-antitoxin system
MLAVKGRIQLGLETESWLLQAVLRSRVAVVPLDAWVAARSCALPLPHADPADRMIVASALHTGAALISADENILRAAKRVGLRVIAP